MWRWWIRRIQRRLLYRPCPQCEVWHARVCACPLCDDTGYIPRRWALRLGLAEERRWDRLD